MKVNDRNGSRDPQLAVFIWDNSTDGVKHVRQLIEDAENRILRSEITAVVSSKENGPIQAIAECYNIPFVHFGHPWTARRYQLVTQAVRADYYLFSRWFKPIRGLNHRTRFNSRTVFTVCPCTVPAFNHGQHSDIDIHEAVLGAFKRNELTSTAMTVRYLSGPTIFEGIVRIDPDDTPEILGKRMNLITRRHLSSIADRVVNGQIRWNGRDLESLTCPSWHLSSLHVDIPTSEELQHE